MRVLFSRKQTTATFTLVPLRVGAGVMFTLWAKADLSEEEQYLVNHYRFSDAILIEGDMFEELRKAFRVSLFLGMPFWLVVMLFTSWLNATVFTLFAVVLFTWYYYDRLRERIYVRDLINGRVFKCHSIVELVQKEAYLQFILSYLRQVLETAKHWDEQETIEILPLSKEEAKEALLPKRRA